MKVVIAIPSNRPKHLESFLNSIEKFPRLRDAVKIAVCLNGRFTGEEKFLDRIDKWWLEPTCTNPVPFALYRRLAMDLFDDADLYWNMDCDHTFHDSKGKVFTKGCEEFNFEVINFFRETPSAGVVACNDFHGGKSSGYDFVKCFTCDKLGNSSGGAFVRNIDTNKIISRYETGIRGAGEDKLMFLNLFTQGYDIYKRFNSPVRWENYILTRGYPRREEKYRNPNYYKAPAGEGVYGYINKKFNTPGWNFKNFPQSLINLHNQNRK